MKKVLLTLIATLFCSMSFAVTELTEKNIQKEMLDQKGLIVVKLYTDECHFCQQYKPIFEAAEKRYPKVKFNQINLSKNPQLAPDVPGVPVTMALRSKKDGKKHYKLVPVNVAVGLLSKEQLDKFIKASLSKK